MTLRQNLHERFSTESLLCLQFHLPDSWVESFELLFVYSVRLDVPGWLKSAILWILLACLTMLLLLRKVLLQIVQVLEELNLPILFLAVIWRDLLSCFISWLGPWMNFRLLSCTPIESSLGTPTMLSESIQTLIDNHKIIIFLVSYWDKVIYVVFITIFRRFLCLLNEIYVYFYLFIMILQ